MAKYTVVVRLKKTYIPFLFIATLAEVFSSISSVSKSNELHFAKDEPSPISSIDKQTNKTNEQSLVVDDCFLCVTLTVEKLFFRTRFRIAT